MSLAARKLRAAIDTEDDGEVLRAVNELLDDRARVEAAGFAWPIRPCPPKLSTHSVAPRRRS